MKKVIFVLLVAGLGAFALSTLRDKNGQDVVNYRLATVEQGDIEALVSATGTLDAVTTVQVGTQVSGIVSEINVDFNDVVKKGQVIARIDTALLAYAVSGAKAQLAQSQAQLRQAEREFDRVDLLYQERLVSDSEYSTAQFNQDSARASIQSAEVDLSRAQQNLAYATITSPIDGTVINRAVDVGQTVQASFSAPELFLIAGDLTQMQILVAVDESDIGQIAKGQTVRFTVQAYAEKNFLGIVRQVRLQSANEENVVNYTAVVDVANPEHTLLPGMTATVDFLVETESDVLYVTNSALRYKPDQEKMAAVLERKRSEREALQNEGQPSSPSSGGVREGAAASNRGVLWFVDASSALDMIPVRVGISDGTNTVVTGRNLEAGLQVIAGVSSSASSTSSTSSPFQQQSTQSSRSGPPSPGGI